MRGRVGARIGVLLLASALGCAQDEVRTPGEFEVNATGGVTEASITGSAVAWLNVAGGQRYFEIRLHPSADAARHIVLTSLQTGWPVAGTYQVTENAPTDRTFDLLYTLDANRLVRGVRGTVEIIESGGSEIAGRFQVEGALIDLSSPGTAKPTVRLEGTFHATCTRQSGETDCG